MTEKDLAVLIQTIAPIVREYAEKAVQEAHTRIAVLEAQQKTIGDVRDRVLVMETKAAHERPDVDQIGRSLLERVAATESSLSIIQSSQAAMAVLQARFDALEPIAKDISTLRERLAVVEVRPPAPGPPGEPGQPGKDGLNGKDGTAGISFEGVYQEGQSYEKGNLVTWGGSSWHCNEPTTTSKPGDGSKDWTLMVKRGRDGRDGLNGKDVAPVVKVT